MAAIAVLVVLVGGLVAVVGLVSRPGAGGPNRTVSMAAGDADPAVGRQLFVGSCAVCHGVTGRGMPEQGVALTGSRFMAHTADDALVAFLRTGRRSNDPATLTGRVMPPRGGNPQLSDQDLADIVSYLRSFQTVASLH